MEILRWAVLIVLGGLWLGICALYALGLVLTVLIYAGKGAERVLSLFERVPGFRPSGS